MKLFSIYRHTQTEPRYHKNMGRLLTTVTTIKRAFLGIPYETLHKYRETYYGKIKNCSDCMLSKVKANKNKER